MTRIETVVIDCAAIQPRFTTGIVSHSMHAQDADINSRIWQVVTLIPEGKVATYGDVAGHAGLPGAARRVGKALRGLPADTRIPWHRVINARGRISLPEGTASYYRQRERLESEGVLFRQDASVDMARFRWRPAGKP